MTAKPRAGGAVSSLVVLAAALFGAGAAEAQVGPTRQLHVTTSPPGVRAATSQNPVAVRTPYSFQIPANAHTALILDDVGLERARVPIPAGAQDLHLDVQMSRPVFEAGVALTVIGAVFLVVGVSIGLAWVADEAEQRDECLDGSTNPHVIENCEANYDGGENFGLAFAYWGAPGTLMLTAGVLMMILDRRREPTWSWGGATP